MLNRLRAIWPEGYLRGSLEKSQVLSSFRFGGSSLGYRAGSLRPDCAQTIKQNSPVEHLINLFISANLRLF